MSLPLSQDRQVVKEILLDPKTLGTILYAISLKFFGTEIHDWEPEMFDLEFRDEFQVEVPKVNQDKLIGLISSIVTNRFYRDFMVFTHVCESLSGNEVDRDSLTPDLLPAEMAWGVIEIRLNDDDDPAFDEEIAAYVGVILQENGFLKPPSTLSFARMPERYLGSDSGEDINQMETFETEHAKVIEEYIFDQAQLLAQQIELLPWSVDELLVEIDKELRKINFLTTPESPLVRQAVA